MYLLALSICAFGKRVVWRTYLFISTQKVGKREKKQKSNRLALFALIGLVVAPLFLNTILFASLVVAQNIIRNFLALLVPYVCVISMSSLASFGVYVLMFGADSTMLHLPADLERRLFMQWKSILFAAFEMTYVIALFPILLPQVSLS